MVVVDRTCWLAAPADVVWQHAASMDGVNRELAPISMSHPPDRDRLDAGLVLGEPLFTSILRFGPVPFDRHVVTLTGYQPGVWFQEDSHSLLHRRWRHRRTVTPRPAGCEVRDLVQVDPRLPGTGALVRWVVGRVFARRHRVLVARFGDGAAPVPSRRVSSPT